MKISRIVMSLIYIITLCFGICACSDEDLNNKTSQGENPTSTKEIGIYDTKDNFITAIDSYVSFVQIEDGFIYAKSLTGSTGKNSKVEYVRYNFTTNEYTTLGIIENWVYEATYDTFSANGHVYLLITTGDSYNFDETENYLYDIDLIDNSMTPFLLKTATSPYNSMTLVDDKIYIVAPGNELCYVSCYDISRKETSEVMNYSFDSESNTGETIRHISADEQFIYLLRLVMNSESDVKMYIDYFDKSFTKINSIEVTNAVTENTLESENKNSERRQLVSHFEIINNVMYYENFSLSRAMFEVGIFEPSIQYQHFWNVKPEIYKALGSSLCEDYGIFYELYSNKIYIVDYETQSINEAMFPSNDEDYRITYMTYSADGNVLVFVEYTGNNTSYVNHRKIYCTTLSDLSILQ